VVCVDLAEVSFVLIDSFLPTLLRAHSSGSPQGESFTKCIAWLNLILNLNVY
jgi:hypothetical protein